MRCRSIIFIYKQGPTGWLQYYESAVGSGREMLKPDIILRIPIFGLSSFKDHLIERSVVHNLVRGPPKGVSKDARVQMANQESPSQEKFGR